MLYTKTLLSRYLTLSSDPHDYAQLLTDRVCEVEEVHLRTIPDEVVIGLVLSVQKHPDADKLVVCQLDCGSAGKFQICTGATNIAAGQYVPVAVPGCHLPAIDLSIAPRQMRGLDSNGMICSLSELGIDLDSGKHWIWVIQGEGLRTDTGLADSPQAGDTDTLSESDCGKPLREVFPRLEGRIIDVENKTITHRPDLFGHFGLAVESRTVSPQAVTYSRLQTLTDQIQESTLMQTLEHATRCDQEITIQSDACRAYTLMMYDNVQVKSSDLYTKVSLLDIGIETTNNRVDFSNLYMQTTGHPVHFFDADRLTGGIIVRQATTDEQFTDLFGTLHTLTVDDLVICDDTGVIALAGIVGSQHSGVTDRTSRIAVEIANFDPVMIRKTALRLGLRTEAQIRYEKNINPLYTLANVLLFKDELAYHAPSLGTPTFTGMQWTLDAGETVLTHRIPYDAGEIRSQVMGESVDSTTVKTITQIFKGLGCTVGESTIMTPVRRGPEDLTGQHDLIEEVARVIGYDQIPERELHFPLQFVPLTPRKKLTKDIESLLAEQYALDQIQTYSWIHDQRLHYQDTPSAYTITNALDSDRRTLRSTMLWSLIEVITKNQGAFDSQQLFDLGRVRDADGYEHQMVGVMIACPSSDDWQTHPQHTLQAMRQDIIETATVRGRFETTKTDHSYAHPLQQATLSVNRTHYGRILTLHPGFVQKHGLQEGMNYVFMEISLTTLLQLSSNKPKKKNFGSIQDHHIRRDVAFVVDREMTYGTITDAVSKVREVQDIQVFDLYAGAGLPDDKKSIGLKFLTRFDTTPSSDQINEILGKVIKAGEKMGGEVRGKN